LYLAFPETTTSILMAVFHANLGKPIILHSYSSICSGRKRLGIGRTFFLLARCNSSQTTDTVKAL